MIIKILGTGCKKCDKLEENTKVALEEMGKRCRSCEGRGS